MDPKNGESMRKKGIELWHVGQDLVSRGRKKRAEERDDQQVEFIQTEECITININVINNNTNETTANIVHPEGLRALSP